MKKILIAFLSLVLISVSACYGFGMIYDHINDKDDITTESTDKDNNPNVDLEDESEGLKQELVDLKNKVESLTNQINEKQEIIDRLENDSSTTAEELATLKSELEELKQENIHLNELINNLEESSEKLKAIINMDSNLLCVLMNMYNSFNSTKTIVNYEDGTKHEFIHSFGYNEDFTILSLDLTYVNVYENDELISMHDIYDYTIDELFDDGFEGEIYLHSSMENQIDFLYKYSNIDVVVSELNPADKVFQLFEHDEQIGAIYVDSISCLFEFKNITYTWEN